MIRMIMIRTIMMMKLRDSQVQVVMRPQYLVMIIIIMMAMVILVMIIMMSDNDYED